MSGASLSADSEGLFNQKQRKAVGPIILPSPPALKPLFNDLPVPRYSSRGGLVHCSYNQSVNFALITSHIGYSLSKKQRKAVGPIILPSPPALKPLFNDLPVPRYSSRGGLVHCSYNQSVNFALITSHIGYSLSKNTHYKADILITSASALSEDVICTYGHDTSVSAGKHAQSDMYTDARECQPNVKRGHSLSSFFSGWSSFHRLGFRVAELSYCEL